MTDSVDTALKESISAMVDGEASELDLQRVLKQASNEAVRQAFRRYHLQEAARLGTVEQVHLIDISESVREAIESESAPQVAKPGLYKRYINSLGKVAVAATVAFGFILGVQQFNNSGSNSGTDLQASNQYIPPAGYEMPALNARTVSSVVGGGDIHTQNLSSFDVHGAESRPVNMSTDPALREYLNRLFLKHSEQSSKVNGITVMPLGRSSRLTEIEE